jgi:hypothetical protein
MDSTWRKRIGYLLQVLGAAIMVASLVWAGTHDTADIELSQRSVEEISDPAVCTKELSACEKNGDWNIPVKRTVKKSVRARVAPEWPALAVMLILLGIPITWPVLLKDTETFSSMRMVLYVLCGVFTLMLVKTGWTADSMSDIKIDPWWTSLLSTALASKAAQSFSENRPDNRPPQ